MSYLFPPDPLLFRQIAGPKALRSLLGAALALSMVMARPLPAAAQDGEENLRAETGRYTGLPLPRYVSIKSSEANMRIGPGEEYAVKWVYQRRHLPVEIIGEYDLWRQVRDRDGEEGWIHSALLDGRRYGVIVGDEVVLTRKPGKVSNKIVATVEANVVVRLRACSPGWCQVEAQGVKGWVERDYLWGLYGDEIFD